MQDRNISEINVKQNQNDIFQQLLQDNNNIEIEKIEENLKIEPVLKLPNIKLGTYEIFSELTEKQCRD